MAWEDRESSGFLLRLPEYLSPKTRRRNPGLPVTHELCQQPKKKTRRQKRLSPRTHLHNAKTSPPSTRCHSKEMLNQVEFITSRRMKNNKMEMNNHRINATKEGESNREGLLYFHLFVLISDFPLDPSSDLP